MARPLNIKLYMEVYKKLINNRYRNVVAKELNVSPTHVKRIADFLVEEYFIVPESLKSYTKLYVKTKRVPTPKILFNVIKSKSHDGESSNCGTHKLQYRSELKSEVSQRVINWCRLITPKGAKKYLFPPNKNLKLGFNIVIHDGKNRKSVMFYPKRIYLTVDELPMSDEIIKEQLQRIAYNTQHFFKIKLGMPKPIGKSKEYAFAPKEKFLVDALEEITFEINSPVGKVKGNGSGDPSVLNGKEIEFDNKDLAMTYAKIIPVVHMTGQIAAANKGMIEHLEQEFNDIKGLLSETKPMLGKIIKYIDAEKEFRGRREKENRERGMI